MKRSKMKTMKKRILALLLCGTMVLNTGVSASADEGTTIIPENTHVHTEECYEKSKTENLICTKPEVAEEAAHVHEEKCFEVTFDQKLTCTQEETAGHSHSDSCVETKDVLTCGTDEHTHGGECYTTETKNVCGQEESETHTHDASCVEETETLTCSVSEHTHSGECYTTETNIVCGQEEVAAHAHGEGCYTTVENKTQICTLEEVEAHTHGDECYEWEENLVCTIPEGTPVQLNETEAVQEPVEEQKEEVVEEETKEVTLQNDDETGIKVSIESTSDVLAEDAKVVVAPMELDETMENALLEATGESEVLGYVAYDISLKNADDTDVSLGGNTVDVIIDFEEAIPEEIDAEKVKEVVLAHITTDEDENVVAETVGTVEITEEKATVEFEAESFSPYIVTYLGEAEEVVEEPVVEDVVLTYTSEDGKYTVTATAKPETMENVAALEATLITEETKVEELTQKLSEKATEAQKTALGFEAYEFKFFDAEGNEVTVNGEVKVSFTYMEAMIPEAATAENIDAVDVALLETAEEGFDEINGLVSAEAGAVKEVVYTTEAPEELILAWSGDVYRALPNYEDDEVVITLEGTEYALQNVVGFNVTPIKEDNEETKEQYAEVAQQLEEKIAEDNEANEEEKEVVGFLAYDITLVDAEGNELEPQGGVRVSMEYKEAAAPEAVAEAEKAEVTIHHFEEDEKGEVKQIVDMVAEEAVEAEVTTTENAEVEKAEFVTDSFSTYTITWTVNGVKKIVAQVVDNSRNPIPRAEDVVISKEFANDAPYVFGNECDSFKVEGKTYALSNVIYKVGNFETSIYAVRYNRDKFQYQKTRNGGWTNFENEYVIYLIYNEVHPITTVDSRSEHINIRVSDYSMWPESEKSWGHNVVYDVNNGRPLKFVSTGSGTNLNAPDYNLYTESVASIRNKYIPYRGIVKNNLYPLATTDAKYPSLKVAEGSLDYLFNNGYDANYLFKKDTEGYYVYNSAENFAELNTSTGDFTVYNQAKKGFFPFNKFAENVEVESTNTSRVSNHHFGMSVDFTFMQPKNGRDNNKDMVFEFSGDDDVWVFIDGMLVLDIGGIHQPTGGTINFATGQVTYKYVNDNKEEVIDTASGRTIRQMYEAALEERYGSDTQKINEELAKYFVDDTSRFKDYSGHALNFYYLERGAHDTNCKIKFNLISIPKDSVTIEKEIVNYAAGAYSDVEFSFNMYLQNGTKDNIPGTANDSTDSADTLVTTMVNSEGTVVSVPYVHVAVNGTRTTKTLGADGVFKLKHKEKAIFEHLDVNTPFYVIETAISQDTYDKVEITGLGVLNENNQSIIQDGQKSISTKTLTIGTDYYAKFQNTCAATNMKHLVIEKKLNGTVNPETEYQMEVKIAGQLYVGEYKVGKDYDSALNANARNAQDGVISLPAGNVAVIMGYVSRDDNGNVKQGIPSGTSFSVKEKELDSDVYAEPTYSVVLLDEEGKGEYHAADSTDSTTGNAYASGKFVKEKNAKVIVTNAFKSSLTVKKEWISNKATHTTPVKVGLYHNTDSNKNQTVELNTENGYSVTIVGLSASDYTIKELISVNDNPELMIGNQGYRGVEAGGNIVIDGDTYKVTYSEPDANGVVTITNTQLAKIIINKVSASDSTHKLEGATFELKKVLMTDDGVQYELLATKTTDANGSITFADLERGTYQIVETKAPEGYLISGGSIEVDLTTGDLTREITVTNEVVYELPSTGGHGIYTTMLSGFALMLGAAYVWFMNRRKEML